jgi:hypothetical protein
MLVQGWGYPDEKNTNPSPSFIKDIETTDLLSAIAAPIGKGDSAVASATQAFRRRCMAKLSKISYFSDTFIPSMERVFNNELNMMQAKQEEVNQQILSDFQTDLKAYLRDPDLFARQMHTPDMQERAERVSKVLNTLETGYGYSSECLPRILDWVFGLSPKKSR